jgi:hypothetical protein
MLGGFALKASPTPMACNSNANEVGDDDLTMTFNTSPVNLMIATDASSAKRTTGSYYRITTSRATGGGTDDSAVKALHAREELSEATRVTRNSMRSISSTDNILLFTTILRR